MLVRPGPACRVPDRLSTGADPKAYGRRIEGRGNRTAISNIGAVEGERGRAVPPNTLIGELLAMSNLFAMQKDRKVSDEHRHPHRDRCQQEALDTCREQQAYFTGFRCACIQAQPNDLADAHAN